MSLAELMSLTGFRVETSIGRFLPYTIVAGLSAFTLEAAHVPEALSPTYEDRAQRRWQV